jgi:MFS family permease
VQWLRSARNDLVAERKVPTPATKDSVALDRQVFDQAAGPFVSYERSIEVVPHGDGRIWRETVRYRMDLPWFMWLFARVIRRYFRSRAPGPEPLRQPIWSPPDRLTARQVHVLGLLAAASLSSAFINTLFTQTVAFASDDFGVGDWGRGVAGTIVRVGILIGLPAAFLADRIGRRRVVVTLAWAAPIIASLGALAPNFPVLVATQTISRPLGLALDLLIAVIAAEEMPKSSRAYAVSILAMANGLGAGVAVIALPLADIGDSGWRLVYVLALIWLVVAVDLTRRLPETARYERHLNRHHVASTQVKAVEKTTSKKRRLGIQMAVAFFGNLLLSPASFFQNSYLKDERGFTAGMVAIFTLVTSTPAVVGLIVGGRVADRRGRRYVAASCVPLGAVLIALSFQFHAIWMWLAAIIGAIVAAAAYPSLAVYRTELFPTAHRGRAAYLILATALLGGSLSLLLTGALLDSGLSYGTVMLALVVGPAMVSVIVLATYPETAHRELEELNPEDAPRN